MEDALRKCPRHPLLWEQVYTGYSMPLSLSKGQSGPGLAPVAGSPWSLSPISLVPGREDFLRHGDKKPTKGTDWRKGHAATRTPQTAEWTATFLGYTPSMRFQSCPSGRAPATQPGLEQLEYHNGLHLGSTDAVTCPKRDIKSLTCRLILETRPHSSVLPVHEEPQARKLQPLAQGHPGCGAPESMLTTRFGSHGYVTQM